ncbi:MAG TPA: pyridoxal-phosphate dependent enzyme [Chitinophagaceae bacterium]|nr:pyridoxal-phosphate dependent enzyme [Chitinophagaceae bacterium]
MELSFESITEDPIHLFEKNNVRVSVLRLDKIHPVISGNKWFKLKYYLAEAAREHKKKIVTFGGAWSNHIVATAAACAGEGFSSAGIIRGEEPARPSASLQKAKEYGMELYFTSRTDYSEKIIPSILDLEQCYFINEGGYGKKGAEGAASILDYCQPGFTHCCCAVGTGTMMAGLINGVSPFQKVIGISVLKNNREAEKQVQLLLNEEIKDWQIAHDYHFGGYAKYSEELIHFMNEFFTKTNIPSDFVYTGKLFFAVSDMIQRGFIPPESNLLLIHSGGLQGNSSLRKGKLIY